MTIATILDNPNDDLITESWFVVRIHSELKFPVFEFQACIEPWTFTNLCVDGSALTGRRPRQWQDVEQTIQSVLSLCRVKFAPKPPKFWHKIHLKLASSEVRLQEVPFIHDFSLLPQVDELRHREPGFETIPIVPLSDLQTIRDRGQFFPPGVRIVRYGSNTYIAKGPVYSLHLKHFVTELENLASLPVHPNIISAPVALLSPEDTLSRICGFLVPYYPKGNLDRYSQSRHATNSLTLAEVLRWFREVAQTILSLKEHNTWHGDLKPDNLLITDEGSVCMTDMTRSMATSVTASPEVRAYCSKHALQDNVLLGVPPAWSIEKILLSETYSLGRTMFLIMTSQSMMDVYEQYGWVSNHNFINNFCDQADCRPISGCQSEPVKATKDLVLACLQKNPADRPSLKDLITSIGAIERTWHTHDILLRASKDRLFSAL